MAHTIGDATSCPVLYLCTAGEATRFDNVMMADLMRDYILSTYPGDEVDTHSTGGGFTTLWEIALTAQYIRFKHQNCFPGPVIFVCETWRYKRVALMAERCFAFNGLKPPIVAPFKPKTGLFQNKVLWPIYEVFAWHKNKKLVDKRYPIPKPPPPS